MWMRDHRVPLPALLYMCHLMLMSMDTSEQFKHSCIVQPGHCGSHCNKSKVTALGGGTGDCYCLNKLYKNLRRYLGRAKGRGGTHPKTFFPSLKCILKCILAHLVWKKKKKKPFHSPQPPWALTSLALLFGKDVSQLRAPGSPMLAHSPSKLTFTI